MSGRDRRKLGPDDVRALFRDAEAGSPIGVERAAARVPAAIAEARRRRAAPPSLAEALVPLARVWLPALAAASLLLAAVAIGQTSGAATAGAGEDDGVDRLVLIGSLDGTGADDPVLRALVEAETAGEGR